MSEFLPEVDASERVARLLGRYLDPKWLTDDCLRVIAGKCVANRSALRAIFAEVDADPRRLRNDGVTLRQQMTQQLEDVDFWREHVHHLKRELTDAEAILVRVEAAHHRDRFDPDARDADREDTREREARQDEAASENAPKVAS